MIRKKYMVGTVICGVTLCTALAFNSFIFSKALAATPDDSGIKSVTESSTVSETAATEAAGSSDAPGINSLTEEKAVEIAQKALSSFLSSNLDVSSLPYDITYATSSVPVDRRCWCALFYDDYLAYGVTINAMTGKVETVSACDKNEDFIFPVL